MTLEIYLLKNYRAYLKALVEPKEDERRRTYASIAEDARIPKSYISRVMKGEAELSPDQLWLVCTRDGRDEEEISFLLLLLEKDRCGVKSRRHTLEQQIANVRARNTKSERHLKDNQTGSDSHENAAYYLDPWTQLVHVALTIPRYRMNVIKLSQELGLPPARLEGILETLQTKGFIERKEERVSVLKDNIHLPKSSPYFESWHRGLRAAAQHQISVSRNPINYSFSVVFSANEDARVEILRKWFDLLSNIESVASACPEEDVFGLNFDLFTWRLEK
jgi:transcriptional regulator with XRE-family HTH domain